MMREKMNIEIARQILASLDSLPQEDAQKEAFFLSCKLDRIEHQREECSNNKLTRDRFRITVSEIDVANQISTIAATATMKYNKYVAEAEVEKSNHTP